MKALILMTLAVFCYTRPARAQSVDDWIQFLLLDTEKLHHLKSILSDMKTGYTIIKNGYEGIKELSQGNFNLHRLYLDGLLAISPAVRDHPLVAETMAAELAVVREYKAAAARWHGCGFFTTGELAYIDRWYAILLDKSLASMGELTMVLTADILRMEDGARVDVVERVYAEIREQLSMLRSFNGRTGLQLSQRIKSKNELQTYNQFYGNHP